MLSVLAQRNSAANSADDIATANQEIARLLAAGQVEGAGRLAEATATDAASLLGPEDPQTLLTLNALADVRIRQHRREEAEALLRRIIAAGIRSFGADQPNTLALKANLAVVLDAEGRYLEAEPLYRETLAGLEQTKGPAHPNTMTARANLAQLLHARGRYDEAAALGRRMLELSNSSFGPDHPGTLFAMYDLAINLADGGHFDEAEILLRRVLDARVRAAGAGTPQTLPATRNLARLLQRKGKLGEAMSMAQKAVDDATRARGADHADTLAAEDVLSSVLLDEGRYDEAERHYRHLVSAYEAAPGDSDARTATARMSLGLSLHEQKRYDEAEPIYRRALAELARSKGAEHPETLTAQGNLAGLLLDRGAIAEAETLMQTTLSAARRVLGDEHPQTLASVNNLAALLFQQQRYTDSEAMFRELYAAAQRALGPEHLHTVSVQRALGAVAIMQGHYEAAGKLLHDALAKSARTLGPTHPLTILIESDAARLLLLSGQHAAALSALKKLEPKLRALAEYDAGQAGSIARMNGLDRAGSDFIDVVLTLAVRNPAMAGDYAATVVARTKYLGADTDAVVARVGRQTHDPGMLALTDRIARNRAIVSRRSAGADASQEIANSLTQLDADEVALAKKSNGFVTARERAARTTLARLLQALPPRALLMDVRMYTPVGGANGVEHYAAILVDRAAAHADVVDLGTVEDTRERTRNVIDLDRVVSDEAVEDGLQIYARVFGKLDARLAAYEQVFIAPDGPLHRVPFHALTLPDGRKWVERQAIHVLSSSRDLLARRPVEPGGESLLAVGGVDYGAKPPPQQTVGGASTPGNRLRRGGLGEFVPLPGSRAEVDALSAAWQTKALPHETWEGAAASEAAFKGLRDSPRYLHLATHGFFLSSQEASARPLQASGVALAGANRLFADDANQGDDGVLYADEVVGLPLDRTDLVVLSACETARGVILAWDGNLGLVRAFRTAGARNVISTLWPISDAYAQPFMQEFYAHLMADPTRDAALALRTTQLSWLASKEPGRANMENWAPIVLVE